MTFAGSKLYTMLTVSRPLPTPEQTTTGGKRLLVGSRVTLVGYEIERPLEELFLDLQNSRRLFRRK